MPRQARFYLINVNLYMGFIGLIPVDTLGRKSDAESAKERLEFQPPICATLLLSCIARVF